MTSIIRPLLLAMVSTACFPPEQAATQMPDEPSQHEGYSPPTPDQETLTFFGCDEGEVPEIDDETVEADSLPDQIRLAFDRLVAGESLFTFPGNWADQLPDVLRLQLSWQADQILSSEYFCASTGYRWVVYELPADLEVSVDSERFAAEGKARIQLEKAVLATYLTPTMAKPSLQAIAPHGEPYQLLASLQTDWAQLAGTTPGRSASADVPLFSGSQ